MTAGLPASLPVLYDLGRVGSNLPSIGSAETLSLNVKGKNEMNIDSLQREGGNKLAQETLAAVGVRHVGWLPAIQRGTRADTVHLYVGSARVPPQSYQGHPHGRWAPEKGPHGARPKLAFTIALGSSRASGGTVRCAGRQR